MKKYIVAFLLSVSTCLGFNVNTSSVTCDAQKVTGNFDSFNLRWVGLNSQQMNMYLYDGGTNNPINFLNCGAACKISRRVPFIGGTNGTGLLTYDLLTTLDGSLSISGNLVSFALAYTNIPTDGQCQCEVWAWNGTTTNSTRTLAQGKITIQNSLYENNDNLFPWPAPLTVFGMATNLANYVMLSNAQFMSITNKVPYNDASYLASYINSTNALAIAQSAYINSTNALTQIASLQQICANAGLTNILLTGTNFQFTVSTNIYYLP